MEAFDWQKTVNYWLEGAEFDLETAKALMASKRYPHALFFGHLAIEKLLKAIFVKQNKEHAPYTHTLEVLAEKSGFSIPVNILKELTEITDYNIEGRYPDFKDNLYKRANKEFTEIKFKNVEEVYKWFHQKL